MIDELFNEYLKTDNLNDIEEMFCLKEWINDNLTIQEKRVLTLYAEYASMREVAKLLNVSHGSVNNYIKAIREKIRNGYYNQLDINSNNCG